MSVWFRRFEGSKGTQVLMLGKSENEFGLQIILRSSFWKFAATESRSALKRRQPFGYAPNYMGSTVSLTIAEMYFGTGEKVPAELEAARQPNRHAA